MKSYLDCYPCFFKQALETARLSGADSKIQRRVLDAVAQIMPDFDLDISPPEMARTIFSLVSTETGVVDPYVDIKSRSNELALEAYPLMQKRINQSDNRLLTAVELAIAGNIIDFGASQKLNIENEIARILADEERSLKAESEHLFQIDAFMENLGSARTLLYLADNAGELVFDRVLIEEIKHEYPNLNITVAVRDKPTINDATIKDAEECNIGRIAAVISSGSDAPGTILSLCNHEFLELFENVDMVISKGQGNFEALSETTRSVFFLLIAKCPIIANHIGCRIRDIILIDVQTRNLLAANRDLAH